MQASLACVGCGYRCPYHAMPVKRKETKGEKKAHKVFREFRAGKLKSSSGQPVTNRKQAIAIALSEKERVMKKKKKK